jgi:RimJ/RimL family protein N-acetyltransferase
LQLRREPDGFDVRVAFHVPDCDSVLFHEPDIVRPFAEIVPVNVAVQSYPESRYVACITQIKNPDSPELAVTPWPGASRLATKRLVLEPVRVAHADEMASLLDDDRLHAFTGGRPATLDELRKRYARQLVGHSADASEHWCNWIARHRVSGSAVGWMQATVSGEREALVAEIAWTIAPRFQRRGHAREASAEVLTWLCAQRVGLIIAHIHPAHDASMAVARALGLTPTDQIAAGEVRWSS